MAESRIGIEKGKAAARAAVAAKATAAAKPAAAPSVVIRRVRKRTDEDGAAAVATLGIGNRRVSTMVDVAPETLALFDASPFSYASGAHPYTSESAAPV